MRKFTLFLLLATSAAPAMALPGEDNRQPHRSEQSEQSGQSGQSDDRPQRAERSERREAREQQQPQVQVERQHSGRQGNDAAVAGMRERYQQAQQQQGSEGPRGERIQRYRQQEQQQVQVDGTRSERLERYRQRQLEASRQAQGGTLLPRQGRIRTIPPTTLQTGEIGPVRTDVRVGTRHDSNDRNRWSNHWRNDHRYDWRRHRDRHRSIFRIGFYYDPFGYSYRRFGLGSYLYPNYYQSNYWINDPWQYRLPPAYGPYRWVRYHNDAVLIDTWTGEVVDVIYGFFW